MSFVNERRKIVAHASSAATISVEDLTLLQEYEQTLLLRNGANEGRYLLAEACRTYRLDCARVG